MLRTYFQEEFYDMPVDIAQKYADGIRMAIIAGKDFEGEKQKGYFLSKNLGFDDKLYVGNIHRIENHLYWNDEELADDDQIVNVVVIDGPVTRDGDGCSYGSKDIRDIILYANTIPQVVGHVFILNTPGGAASARIDFEQAIADCREKGKPTVAWVDGMCCSAGQLVASLCDRTVVMNGRHTMGCIGTMCAFWGVANGTVDKDGYRYIELVSVTSPDKNAEYREACDGKTEKLQAELNKLGEEFRETVRQNRPLVKEEHLTGKTFDAQDVMGALVDEIGDYNRAIECVFELANQKMPAARFVTEDTEKAEGTEEAEEQKDMATLNEQQEAAIATNPGATMIVDEGHVKTSVETMFGPIEQEIATPKNDSTMTDEEKKAAEAEAAQAAEQEEAATESQPTEQEAEVPSTEETPATEKKPAAEEAPAAEEEPFGEAPSNSPEGGEQEQPADNDSEGAPAENAPSEEAVADATAEIDRITETLHNAEALVEEKDKEIATLKGDMEVLKKEVAEKDATIATMEGAIQERDAAIQERDDISQSLEKAGQDYAEQGKALSDAEAKIAELKAANEKLIKQVDELKAEVKELSEKPTPMVTAESGVPADNGTGEAPKVNKHQRIKPNMSYAEIRALQKEE